MSCRVKLILFICCICTSLVAVALPCKAQAGLIIHAKNAIDFTLQGFDGLQTFQIHSGNLSAGASINLKTEYKGLAMLEFPAGQKYPLIISDKSSFVTIANYNEPPSFAAGDANEHFYQLLKSKKIDVQVDKDHGFTGVLIRGKKILDSSSSIKTVQELHAKKTEFQEFIQHNYRDISRSDLLGRIIGRYFMMHEYVSYHQPGSPAGDINERYQQEVLDGVRNILAVLKNVIPENQLLNYCVGLYYDRGMVTMAAFIADNFKEIAYCEGEKKQQEVFPSDLKLVNADGSAAGG